MHAPGKADLNLYAYVHGAVLKAIDPVGLDDNKAPDAGAAVGPPANESTACWTDECYARARMDDRVSPKPAPDAGAGMRRGGGNFQREGPSATDWEPEKPETSKSGKQATDPCGGGGEICREGIPPPAEGGAEPTTTTSTGMRSRAAKRWDRHRRLLRKRLRACRKAAKRSWHDFPRT